MAGELKKIGKENDPEGMDRKEQPYRLNLVPFARGSDQEFALPKGKLQLWHDGSGTWDDNHPGWDNGGSPWDNYGDGGWDNHGAIRGKIIADAPLKNFIQLRRDNDQHGFVSNLKTNVVFLADAQTLSILSSLMQSHIGELAREHPEVLSALV